MLAFEFPGGTEGGADWGTDDMMSTIVSSDIRSRNWLCKKLKQLRENLRMRLS